MKTIGLLGGTAWPSTITYYALLNKLVNERLGGYHSAKIVLKSIDYHDIMSNYGQDSEKIADIIHTELIDLSSMNPDCIIICCNSLHKYYDMVKYDLYFDPEIPVFHAVELVANYAEKQGFKKVLLLATQFTMEDGFFAQILKDDGIEVVVPEPVVRNKMQEILSQELVNNVVTHASRDYFKNIIAAHVDCDAVVIGCTEYASLIDEQNSALPIINPLELQCYIAVEYALNSLVEIEEGHFCEDINLCQNYEMKSDCCAMPNEDVAEL